MDPEALTEAEQARRSQLGSLISRGRRQAGLTRAELAERIGMTPSQVMKLEDGRADASVVLQRIAEAIGAAPEWFGTEASDSFGTRSLPQPFEHLDETERMGRQIAHLETQLAEHSWQGDRIIELEAKLAATEERLQALIQQVGQQAANGQHSSAELDGAIDVKDNGTPEGSVPSDVGVATTAAGLDVGLRNGSESDSATVVPSAQLADSQLEAAAEVPSRRSSLFRRGLIGLILLLLIAAGVLAYLWFRQEHPSQPAHVGQPAPVPEVRTTVRPAANRPAARKPVKPTVPSGPRGRMPIATPVVPAVPVKRHVRPPLAPAETPVLVLNGNGVTGAAAHEASLVRQLGYPVSQVTNASRHDYASSVVLYSPGLRAEALKLAHGLSLRAVSPWRFGPDGLGPAKLVVILGRT